MAIASPKTAQSTRLSIEEFLNYDGDSSTRYELVDGVVVEMGAESTINTLISGYLFSIFLQLGLPSYLIGFKQWIAVSSQLATARDPDLLVHSEASFAAIDGASQALIKPGYPAPTLVIEVVSPGEPGEINYERDYVEKRKEYAQRRISEYWIVDPSREIVMVLALDGSVYQEVGTFRGDDSLISPSFAELNLTVEQVLRAGRPQ